MNTFSFARPWWVLGLLAMALTAAMQADVRKVPLARVPAVVRDAINRTAGTAKINSINRRAENGETTFEVSIQRNGVGREFSVSDDGDLLAMEIGLDEVPVAARGTIQRVLGTNKAERIDRTEQDGMMMFEISYTRGEQDRDFMVSAEGMMTRYELAYTELPRVVRAAVEKQIATNQLERVDRTFDQGELNYDVQFTSNGYPRVLTIGTNGVLARIEVGLNETPAPVRKAILAQVRDWKLGDIDKVFSDGEVTFDVEAKKGRVTREFTIGSGGKLLSELIPLADVPPAVRKVIESKVGAGKITRIDRSYEEDGTVSFDIEAKRGGQSLDFSVGADGKVLEE